MKVSTIMSSVPISVEGDATLSELVEMMDRLNIRHVPVTERGELAGMISDRDLLEATGWGRSEGAREKARNLMHGPVETIADSEDASFAAHRMLESGISCLPVVESGALVGVVTEHDVLKAFVEAAYDETLPESSDPPVAEVMSREVRALDPRATIDEALELFSSAGIRHIPLVHKDRLVGIVSERDLLLCVGRHRSDSTLLAQLVPKDVVSVEPGCKLSDATGLLVEHRIGALPVVDHGKLTGILTTSDVLRHFSELPAELPAPMFSSENPPELLREELPEEKLALEEPAEEE